MGSLAKNLRNVRGLRLGVLCVTALTLFPGCDTKTDKGTISSASFSAAQLVDGGVSRLSTKLDLLR